MQRVCYRCGADLDPIATVGRRDACLKCGADLHCCRNCDFHDPRYHNECTENQAERQVEKEAGNFCDFFRFRKGPRAAGGGPTTDARAKLDALFKKK